MSAERLRDVYGGWLRATDRADSGVLAVHRRAQHNRAAHRTWGVAGGLDVQVVRSGAVLVAPGVAVDPCGRMLVLRHQVRLPDPLPGPRRVVLGAGAAIRLTDRPGPLDVPLARVEQGPFGAEVHDGDGDRVWAARPGPAALRSGTLARGAPLTATGTGSEWTATVSFGGAPYPAPPYVVATPVGPPPPGHTAGTAEIVGVTGTGFDVTVRHRPDGTSRPVHATTVDVGWLAVLPADRIAPAPEEAP